MGTLKKVTYFTSFDPGKNTAVIFVLLFFNHMLVLMCSGTTAQETEVAIWKQ